MSAARRRMNVSTKRAEIRQLMDEWADGLMEGFKTSTFDSLKTRALLEECRLRPVCMEDGRLGLLDERADSVVWATGDDLHSFVVFMCAALAVRALEIGEEKHLGFGAAWLDRIAYELAVLCPPTEVH